MLPSRLSDSTDARERFEREARAVAALSHPNILAIHEFGLHEGSAFVVMGLLQGETLQEKAFRRTHAHTQGRGLRSPDREGLAPPTKRASVHRDLKPANIFVTADGQVKILDFGLAIQSAETIPTTARTPPRCPASRARGHGGDGGLHVAGAGEGHARRSPVRHLFFGAVLYEMATGRRAFDAPSRAETMAAIVKEIITVGPGGTARAARPRANRRPLPREEPRGALPVRAGPLVRPRGARRPLELHDGRAALRRLAGRPLLWLAVAAASLLALGGAFLAGRRSAPRALSAGVGHAAFSQLTDLSGAETSPRLSPDGKNLLFVSRASGNADIYLQRVGGHNPINITKDCPKDDVSPAFSPDGERIAFRSECEGGGIFVMGATGESKNRLTDFGHDPSWSPDPSKIVVATQQLGIRSTGTRRARSGSSTSPRARGGT